jgi:hypothetical protein
MVVRLPGWGSWMNPFRPKAPPPIEDVELGTLRFSHGRWQTEPAPDGTVLLVRAGRRGPDAGLRAAAVHARRELAVLAGRAREYLTNTADPARPWAELTLVAVEVLCPAAGWFEREIALANSAVRTPGVEAPAFVLSFSIEEDRNVLEVIFVRDLPMAWDYH